MSFCQIFNMDIIPETATITSIIIIAKYFEMGFTMNGRPNNKRNQMTFRIMGFPDKGVMEENTMYFTPVATMASRRFSMLETLL